MNSSKSQKTVVLACAALASLGLLAGAVKPVEAAPQMAVYTGPAPQGPAQNAQWASWIGKTNVWGEDFPGWENWGEIENPAWLYNAWGPWEKSHPTQNMLLSVPMLPSDGSGNLAGGASGAYDSHFQALFNNLKNAGVTRAVLRIGWEMNGGWYPWSPGNDATNIANWKTYFNRIASIAHNTSGASFKVCWNPNSGWNQQPTDQLWPGKTQVDYIGVDVYDDYPHGGNGSQNQYANTGNSTYQPTAAQQVVSWADYKDNYGLDYYASLSQQQGLPLIVPEWGVWGLNQGRPAGGDNPSFIQNMYDWMNANNVAVQCYSA